MAVGWYGLETENYKGQVQVSSQAHWNSRKLGVVRNCPEQRQYKREADHSLVARADVKKSKTELYPPTCFEQKNNNKQHSDFKMLLLKNSMNISDRQMTKYGLAARFRFTEFPLSYMGFPRSIRSSRLLAVLSFTITASKKILRKKKHFFAFVVVKALDFYLSIIPLYVHTGK